MLLFKWQIIDVMKKASSNTINLNDVMYVPLIFDEIDFVETIWNFIRCWCSFWNL